MFACVTLRSLTACILLLVAVGAAANSREDCEREFSPRSGQDGKDVIWVPTQEDLVRAMLRAANVTSKDFVVDLGSGDGRIPIAAAKHFGARALGIEYNPKMVELAQCYVRAEGLSQKVTIKQGDIFEEDFSGATVVTMYLLSELNMRLRPTLLKMRPGTRVVSNSFKMGEWSPDEHIDAEGGYARAYLWIVPAQIDGTWSFRQERGEKSFDLRIQQDFQEIAATMLDNEDDLTVSEARLRGADIELTLLDREQRPRLLKGTVEGDTIRLTGEIGGKVRTFIGRRT